MSETYCGKDCAACVNAAGCPGCMNGPGDDCPIAGCCREKGHDACSTCTLSGSCGKLRAAPEEAERRGRDIELRSRAVSQAGTISARVTVLFWLLIGGLIASLLISTLGAISFGDAAEQFDGLLSCVVSAVYACVLLTLGGVNPRFKKAAVMSFASLGLSAASWLLPGAPVAAALLVAASLPFGILYIYNEVIAYAEILRTVDAAQSEKWRWFWKYYAAALIAAGCSPLVALFFLGLGALLLLAASVAMLVIQIVEMVYLYRTAKIFAALSAGD